MTEQEKQTAATNTDQPGPDNVPTPANKRRTRTIRDWDSLREEFIRSEISSLRKFFLQKDIPRSTYTAHTHGWIEQQRNYRGRVEAELRKLDAKSAALTLKQLQAAQGEVTKGNYELFKMIYPVLLREAQIKIDSIYKLHAQGQSADPSDIKYLFDLFRLCKQAIGADVKTNEIVNERPTDHIVIDDKADLKNPELDDMRREFDRLGEQFGEIIRGENTN